MNTRKAAAAIIVTIVAAAAFPTLNWAQDSEEAVEQRIEREVEARLREQEKMIRGAEDQERIQMKQAAKQAAEAEKVVIKAAKNTNHNFYVFADMGEGLVPLGTKIREASAAIRDAKDDESREKATNNLASALDEFFETDMKVRAKELEGLRSRLAKLEAQLNRRRQKKAEIIDLQMKVAFNEADGMGFYSVPQDRPFGFTMPPPMTALGMPGEITIAAPVRVETATPSTFDDLTAPPAPVAAPAPAASPDSSDPR